MSPLSVIVTPDWWDEPRPRWVVDDFSEGVRCTVCGASVSVLGSSWAEERKMLVLAKQRHERICDGNTNVPPATLEPSA